MKFLFVILLVLAACDNKASSGGVPVRKGDPNRHMPKRKEKSTAIVTKFSAIGITVDCPSCSPDSDDSLQALYDAYSDFTQRKARISQISLGDSDVLFDGKNRSLMMPKNLTDAMVTDFFMIQKHIETLEGMTRVKLSFPRDTFKLKVLEKALTVVAINKTKLHTLSAKIDWIDFDGTHSGCADRTWSISRDDFENHFDQSFGALKCP
jgi:hypothetical protein